MIGLGIAICLFVIVFLVSAEGLKHADFGGASYILAFCATTLGFLGLCGGSVANGTFEISPLLQAILLPYKVLIPCILLLLICYPFLRRIDQRPKTRLEQELEEIDREIKRARHKNGRRRGSDYHNERRER